MPVGIGRREIGGRPGVARRPIASRYGAANNQEPTNFPTKVTNNWSPPRAGFWKFILWSEGGGGTTCGSGAYAERTVHLVPSQTVTVLLAVNNESGFGNGATSSVTFPDGSVMQCTGGTSAAGGVASGGDVNLNGSFGAAGQGTGGGAYNAGGGGAPANLPYQGGQGGSGGTYAGVPGGGAGSAGGPGGAPQCLAVFLHE